MRVTAIDFAAMRTRGALLCDASQPIPLSSAGGEGGTLIFCLLALSSALACTPGGLSTNPASATGSTGASTTATSTGTATSTTSGTTTGSASTSSSGGTTGSLTLAGCLDGGVCCGWDWTALDATCPTQGSLGGFGSAFGSLYAGANVGPSSEIFLLSFDGGLSRTMVASVGADAFAVADAGVTFVAENNADVYVPSLAGQSDLQSLSEPVFGVAAGPTAVFLSTVHGAIALGYPQGGSWSPLWSNAAMGSIDLQQLVMVGNNQGVLAAAESGGVALLSAATGNYCYTDACVVPDGGPVHSTFVFFDGAAVDPTTGNIFLVGFAAANNGAAVEELDANLNCVFLRATGCSTIIYGACANQCVEDLGLGQSQLLQAAYVNGTLYAVGLNPVGVGNENLYTYDLDAGLQLVSDAGYYALTAGP